ncbi:MAG: acyl-CoA dehydrogenase C-terminal domain-containing protein [Actinomycetota bacterium]
MSAALLRYLTASQQNPDEVYKIGLVSVRFLHAFGDLVIGWRLLAGAEIAAMALDRGADERDASFYQGKIAAASFFASTVLPRLSSDRAVVETVNTDIMELDEAAF